MFLCFKVPLKLCGAVHHCQQILPSFTILDNKKDPSTRRVFFMSTPKGFRTPVAGMKIPSPRPLDDGGI